MLKFVKSLRLPLSNGLTTAPEDVVVYDTENSRVAIFEAKYAKSLEQMEQDSDSALQQIDEKCMPKNMKMSMTRFYAMVLLFSKSAVWFGL